MTRKLSEPGIETGHRVSITSVSRTIRRLLRNGTPIGWQSTYLFTMAVHIWSQVPMRQRKVATFRGSYAITRAGTNDSAERISTKRVDCQFTR
jgi:hypothetical protein